MASKSLPALVLALAPLTLVLVAIAVVGITARRGSTESGAPLSREASVAAAERFVRANGYTEAPAGEVKERPDLESLERTRDHREALSQRHGSLRPTAIGVRGGEGEAGWAVAFDYADSSDRCRVVRMNADGTAIRLEHQDGVREHWVGFESPGE